MRMAMLRDHRTVIMKLQRLCGLGGEGEGAGDGLLAGFYGTDSVSVFKVKHPHGCKVSRLV